MLRMRIVIGGAVQGVGFRPFVYRIAIEHGISGHVQNRLGEVEVLAAGGVFARAEGLADEIRADLYAADVNEAMKIVEEHPVRIPKPDVPEPGRRRKRRRKTAAKMRSAGATVTACVSGATASCARS